MKKMEKSKLLSHTLIPFRISPMKRIRLSLLFNKTFYKQKRIRLVMIRNRNASAKK